ncbi:TlyA family RNA methyltransferase [Naumannella halotolerans]|uniref:23S rRNA (Cytidine1920-2'-O)/16S rRNA (Cytidine1409-2'-O)-methyltransferase n=1 Tax=Naumannella halotolerans TaxID=993414 RepID=A0A4R7J794_9ACTN|nr:TlyA family RNA methyltransferase [Naumannella halotolerans]TDT33095.1 23S rRNA (cytidine1920-2'-O)/16S rRNA (cytidine1409-2'-O)-methyltransferase [Naumannella halotolerans]
MSERLDVALAARGLARSRTAAAAMIRAGEVTVDGTVVTRPGITVSPDARIGVAEAARWVSRAADKLIGALDAFDLQVGGRALDAGASTGGFSQVLLDRGCREVYAVDVGHDQLAAPLRQDPRVHNLEGLHLRDLELDRHLAGRRVDLAVGDVSFISLTKLLAPILDVVDPAGWALLLVKPQFEVGRSGLDKHGVVANPGLRQQAVDRVVACADALGWHCRGTMQSPLPGTTGNLEHFVHLTGS